VSSPTPLTSSQVLATATTALVEGGYSLIPLPSSWTGNVRLFEDEYGIVALSLFDTWRELLETWNVAQGLMVDLISEHLSRPEPKAWEGYLVLLTTAPVTASERNDVASIQRDTSRVRKLVITGSEVETLDDVRTALLPLLPLDFAGPATSQEGLMDQLPQMLADAQVSESDVRSVVDAFTHNESIVERLHQSRAER
jgi:hypothetical protein